MKTIFSTLIAIVLFTSSCEKEDKRLINFEGNWVIKKMLVDPGNGSGRYQDVPGNPTMSFTTGGAARSTYQAFGLHMLQSYEVIDSVKLVFSFKDVSSQPSTPYRYKFSGDTLILNPPCIEGCGLKLVKGN